MRAIEDRVGPKDAAPLMERVITKNAAGEVWSVTISEGDEIRGYWVRPDLPDPLPGPSGNDGREWLTIEIVETPTRSGPDLEDRRGPAAEPKPLAVPPEDGQGDAERLRSEIKALEDELDELESGEEGEENG